MLESFRIFNVAEQRQRVAPDLRLSLRERWALRQRCPQCTENRHGECRRCGAQDGSTTELHANTPADRFSLCGRWYLCRFFGPPPAVSHIASAHSTSNFRNNSPAKDHA